MQGELAKIYDHWKYSLIHVLALIEAYLDFLEDDIPDEVIKDVNNKVLSLKQAIANHP
jgi:tRNA modification GTPase